MMQMKLAKKIIRNLNSYIH